MSDKINEVVADLRETARVLSVDVKGFEATAIEIAKTATEVESEWEIVRGRITELERQLAERDALLAKLAYTIKQTWRYLEAYENDADDATHAKRVLYNAMMAGDFPDRASLEAE